MDTARIACYSYPDGFVESSSNISATHRSYSEGTALLNLPLDRSADGCAGFRRQQRSRREALQAGALALTGLGLPVLFHGRAQASPTIPAQPAGFGKAKSCILIFQWGGPSHLDTWDPKPEAPDAIRGPFQSIETKTPGVRISEHFPKLALQTHRLTIVRSMTHDDPAHLSTAHRVLTGHLAPTPYSDAAGPSPQDWPHLGAVVAKVRPSRGVLPSSVTMPWTVAHPAAPGGRAPGQNAGWLGKRYEPFRVEGDPNAPGFRVGGLDLPEGVSNDRMSHRRDLLSGSGPVSEPPHPRGIHSSPARSTRWPPPKLEARFGSIAKTRASATATAGTFTASAC